MAIWNVRNCLVYVRRVNDVPQPQDSLFPETGTLGLQIGVEEALREKAEILNEKYFMDHCQKLDSSAELTQISNPSSLIVVACKILPFLSPITNR